MPGARRGVAGRHWRRLLQHRMGVGATKAEAADAGTPRRATGRLPVAQLRIDGKRAAGEIDLRVSRFEVQAGHDTRVFDRQGDLYQPGHAGSRIEVADIGLERADPARITVARAVAENARECRDLDRVAQMGSGTMGLDVLDVLRPQLCSRLSERDRARLALDARRGVAHLGRAVVVDGRAADDGVHVVAVTQRLGQALEHHQRHPVATHGAVGTGVESAAVAVARADTLLDVDMARHQRDRHRNATGQRHVAFVVGQRAAGLVHRHQGSRAGGLHVQAGATQVELVRDPGCQEILPAGQHTRQTRQ